MFTAGWLGFRLNDVGFASGYIDRFSHIAAQDEALYTNSILTMARGGDWLTPMFLHRFGLYKPPLLYWLSALSVRAFGEGTLQVRLPSVLAGAFVACLVFLWARRRNGFPAGLACTLLLIGNPLFHTLGRLALTDMLLLATITAAVFILSVDPEMHRRRSAVLYGIAPGLSLMTKGAAGLLPLLVLGLYWLLAKPRPRFSRLLIAGAVTVAVAAPWHLYQYIVHQRWFWAEYILTEHLAYGLGSPPQTTQEQQALFYLKRLFLVDAPLLCAAAAALWFRRKRTQERTLLFSWIAVAAAAVMTYQYRNVSYLLLMIPPLCLLVAALPPRALAAVAILGAVLLAIRPQFPDEPYGVSFRTGTTIPSAAALASYAGMHRTGDLILVEPDDEFLSAVMPIAHVRYLYIAPAEPQRQYALDFYDLGIAMRAPEFDALEQVRPKYAQRLREWGLPDDQSLATAVLATDWKEIGAVIDEHPSSDFLIRGKPPVAAGSHETAEAPGGYTLLLGH